MEDGPFFQEALEQAVYGEELGFASVWLEAYHSVHNHYGPSPLIALVGIAMCTSRILLGTDVSGLPLYHPVCAAEDSAMLHVWQPDNLGMPHEYIMKE
jgi:alkanesulfonate monooxygenase SsuD/methylene tetrahydromethanopterin reductase-like flavin-dependent oxidoreductase (luciferase family)